ncbi:hypothetical protein ACFYZB_39730 [Streptomyces sp. NPDC001852]|uniref:hypothetical protein n=1 Tax=Streptomyces sp. NPDC001852 TaxID=3364619 RepID=UPI0036A46F7A
MVEISLLGSVGPAQSDELVHFTSRGREPGPGATPDVRAMTASQRLDSILGSETLRTFAPYGVARACACFSESPANHLAHLIVDRQFEPWGIVATRDGLLAAGGGAVAYVPDEVYNQLRAAGLEHWAVRTGAGSTWMHEREWRVPAPDGTAGMQLYSLRAVLVGDRDWRPSPVRTGLSMHMDQGTLCEGCPDPFCEEMTDLPRLWLQSEIWVWDPVTRQVELYPPGALR